jgi:hypothetical protein
VSLPAVTIPVEVVTLSDGQTVSVRSLTFAQTRALAEVEGAGLNVMLHVIAGATGSSVAEVEEWCSATPFGDVQAVADAARRVSRLDDPEGEASGAPSSSANGTRSDSSSPSVST